MKKYWGCSKSTTCVVCYVNIYVLFCFNRCTGGCMTKKFNFLPDEALEDGCIVMPIEQISVSSFHMIFKQRKSVIFDIDFYKTQLSLHHRKYFFFNIFCLIIAFGYVRF